MNRVIDPGTQGRPETSNKRSTGTGKMNRGRGQRDRHLTPNTPNCVRNAVPDGHDFYPE